MKFLVDAHLPRRLVYRLREASHDAIHTLDMPLGNRTPDADINALSLQEERVVITKDAGFASSFLVSGRPHKLLLVSTGNISNRELEDLFVPNIAKIVEALEIHGYVELTRSAVIYHR